jgi:hypothetical protein
MPEIKAKVHYVESCNLGKFGSNGVALKINFAMTPETLKKGPHRSAVFGLTPELARGLAKALTTVLDQPATSTQPKPN